MARETFVLASGRNLIPTPPTLMPHRLLLALASCSIVASSACAGHRDPEAVVAPAPVADTVTAAVRSSQVLSAAPIDSSTVREYRGAYSTGFEMSWFEPCDAPRGDALWWVTLTEDARLQRDSLLKLLPRRPTEGLVVQWRGTVSPKMRGGAGQMGRGSRYILVTRIIALRALGSGEAGACGPVGRVG
jgi:hypothetical protein